MNNNNIVALNPTRSIYSIVGNLCNNPDILKNPTYIIGARDFVQEFHKIVYGAINQLALSNKKIDHITPIDIDNFLAAYPVYYKIWDENNGINYVKDAKDHANEEVFESDYNRLKKYSLLRNYMEIGVDVSDVYDYKSLNLDDQNESSEKLESMSTSDIIEYYTQKMINIRDEWNIEEGVVLDFKAGDGLDTLLERIQEAPDFGFPFPNPYYNSLFRGMREGKFLLRSGSTGTGKTRQAIRDMCNVACDSIYKTGYGWQSLGESYPSLFISTELDKDEVQLIMLAYITGIPDDVIKNGNYDSGTEHRLEEGLKVLQRAPLFASYIEDFSISDIEMKIEQYIINHHVKYVAFDYIQMVPKLSKTMQHSFGQNLREDQILVNFASALKNISTRYNIFLESSTQLNRGSKEIENRDASSLRGGLSTADKIDHGVLTFKVNKQDKENIKHILKKGFENKEPNFAHWVYKNRAGLDHIIVWSQFDLGNMREEVLFVTDYDFNIVEIDPLELEIQGFEPEVSNETIENNKEISF